LTGSPASTGISRSTTRDTSVDVGIALDDPDAGDQNDGTAPDRRTVLADALFTTEQRRTPIEPFTSLGDDLAIGDTYAIQGINVQRRLDGGARIIGRKVSSSRPAHQAHRHRRGRIDARQSDASRRWRTSCRVR